MWILVHLAAESPLPTSEGIFWAKADMVLEGASGAEDGSHLLVDEGYPLRYRLLWDAEVGQFLTGKDWLEDGETHVHHCRKVRVGGVLL